MERESLIAARTSMHGACEILDACCGGRMWWWDKNHPLAVYMDRREAPPGSSARRPNWHCQPSLLADFKDMPFDDATFQLVLFDPPHLVRDQQSFSEVRLRYGEYTSANEQEEIGLGFAECWRVLAPGGTLVFKWAGSLERVEPHFPCDPIVGSRGPVRSAGDGQLGTRWFIFYKPMPTCCTVGPEALHLPGCPLAGEQDAGLVQDGVTLNPGREHPSPAPLHPHVFRGRQDRWCEVCNKPDRHSIHVIPDIAS